MLPLIDNYNQSYLISIIYLPSMVDDTLPLIIEITVMAQHTMNRHSLAFFYCTNGTCNKINS